MRDWFKDFFVAIVIFIAIALVVNLVSGCSSSDPAYSLGPKGGYTHECISDEMWLVNDAGRLNTHNECPK